MADIGVLIDMKVIISHLVFIFFFLRGWVVLGGGGRRHRESNGSYCYAEILQHKWEYKAKRITEVCNCGYIR